MRTWVRKHFSAIWLYGILGVDVALLAATFAMHRGLAKGTVLQGPLRTLDVGAENNVGAWWSGMVLLIAAVHAFDGFPLWWRQHRPRLAWAWAILALVLVALSADEISSLHERVDMVLKLGTWKSIAPFGAVLLGLVAFALLSLHAVPEERGTVWQMSLGFLLLGSAALQEKLEHSLDWGSGLAPVLRMVVEEGSELLGGLILLRACMRNTQGVFGIRGAPAPTLEAVDGFRTPFLAAGVLLAVPLGALTALLATSGRGRPASWLAAASFGVAALAQGRDFFRGADSGSAIRWVLCGLCGLASLLSVQISPGHPSVFLLSGVSLAISALWVLGSGPARRAYLPVAISGGLLAAVVPFAPNALSLYLGIQLLGVLVYWGSSAETSAL